MTTMTQSTARPEPALSLSVPRAGTGNPLVPTTSASELRRQLPDLAWAFFEMVAAEPLTAVGVVALDGTSIYMSENGANLLGGDGASNSQFVGRSLNEFFPPEIANERIAIFKRTQPDAPPLLIRNLWNGNQLTAWFRRFPTCPGAPDRDIMIVRGRLIPGDLRSLFPREAVTLVYSSFVRLGPLACLTDQELRVMALIGAGMTVRESAKVLFRAEKTIESHCMAIHRKLGLRDRVEVAKLAQRAGLSLEDADRVRV